MTRSGWMLVVACAVLIGAGGWVLAGGERPREVVEVVPATASLPGGPVPARAAQGMPDPAAAVDLPGVAVNGPGSGVVTPSFDVVRVGPGGSAVIAGRAAAGAEVIVRDGAVEVARARAGRDGTFVALPAAPLAAGGRELTLASREGAGGETKGDGSVLVLVPERPAAALTGPLGAGGFRGAGVVTGVGPAALFVPDAGRPAVLDRRQEGVAGPTLDTVDYDSGATIRFTGGGAIGQALRIYVDNLPSGEVTADGRGRWALTPGVEVPAGVHSLRVDQVDGGGRVVARVEVPFERASVSGVELAAAGGHMVVQPGQTLWRMARAAYGRGLQYRVIYLANREQIRDPGRIYPGQVFAVPAAARRDGGG